MTTSDFKLPLFNCKSCSSSNVYIYMHTYNLWQQTYLFLKIDFSYTESFPSFSAFLSRSSTGATLVSRQQGVHF